MKIGNSRIMALMIVACSANPMFGSAEEPEGRARAREVFEASSAAYKDMFRAVGHIRARLVHEHLSTGAYEGQNPVIDLPKDEAGRIPVTLSLSWTCDLAWDRATGNAVSETVRVSHKVNGTEHIRTPRPALYYCIDGVSTGHYAVVTSSLDDEAGWQPSAEEDVGLIKDYTALARLRGARIDNSLDGLVRTVLRPDGTVPYVIAVVEEGGEIRVQISSPTESPNAGRRETYSFRTMSVGPVLTGYAQTRTDGWRTSLEIEYREVPVEGSANAVLPVRWVEEHGWAVGETWKPTLREDIRAVEVNASAAPLDRGALREDIAIRYGVAAANTLDEWLRAAPVTAVPAIEPGT